jgi:S-adenosylmethionine:tRNA ribosyltransferase-isomerase
MKTSDFNYDLPPELIAQHPCERRDASRMLVINRAAGTWEHRLFADLSAYLRAGDLLVVNDTRVIPARLFGRKPGTGGKAELFLLEEVAPGEWDILMRCRRRPGPGGYLELEDGAGRAHVLSYGEEGQARVRFETAIPFMEYVERYGHVPLPPYIKRVTGDQCPVSGGENGRVTGDRCPVSGEEGPVTGHWSPSTDQERYQTIYARDPGAVAAPTAGLHFTPEMFARLAAQGVARADVTLHVGIGTFRPVSAERLEDHRMHEERYQVPPAAADAVNRTRAAGGRIVAVGSTSVRTLESVADAAGHVTAGGGRTGIFIHPPYSFRAVDLMLTNFHLPQSTLLMMVCALAGRELVLRAYEDAVKERYRFFSYGDCMLIA